MRFDSTVVTEAQVVDLEQLKDPAVGPAPAPPAAYPICPS